MELQGKCPEPADRYHMFILLPRKLTASGAGDSSNEIDTAVEDIGAVMEAMGIAKVTLAKNFGAVEIASAFAARFPARVAGVVSLGFARGQWRNR